MMRPTLATALTLSLAATSAHAAILSGTAGLGDTFSQISPPAAVGNNNQQTNNTLFAFNEKQNVTLSAALDTDLTFAGPPSTLPIGSLVSSHYVFVDPSAPSNRVTGTVTFDQPILGVIFDDTKLDASASQLGAPGTTYFSPSLLGLESGDIVTIPSANTVSIDFTAGSPGDYIRVITQGVPEPASASLLALTLLTLRRR
ncbi:MAG: hypothetical protein RLN76_12940 [Phycisphaeraceae bacterium]